MKKNIVKRLLLIILCFIGVSVLVGCSDADIASQNLSKDADNFKINRRIVFYNWITNEYILTIEWFCSLGNYDSTGQLSVTCKTWLDDYKKHFLWLSDNVTYFVEQIDWKNISVDHYKVIFKPNVIIPDVEIR